MSLTSLLGVGASGMRAATLGVNIASQNVTNATTAGYSRRSIKQEPLPGPPNGGNGVRTHGPMRAVDRFVERRLLGSTAAHAEAGARLFALGPLDALLAEDAGLGEALDAFQSALEALSASPSDRPTRQAVLARAEGLASAFRRTSEGIAEARADADTRIADEVQEANGLMGEIDRIQVEMKKAEISGEEASDLRDQRDQRIHELSGLLPIKVIDGDASTVSVLLDGGISLVHAEGGTSPLAATRDTTTGFLRVTRISAGAVDDVTARIGGGSIGGLLAARDGALADAGVALDQLAFDVASAYSGAHAAGVGLDGASGRALFSTTPMSVGAALGFAVSSDVAGQPDRLAAATDPALVSGDNRNALLLARLSTSTFATGGRTAGEALADLLGSAGGALETASRDTELLGAAESQAIALRESISGVSTDDEMIALTGFQRAYEASLKVVQAADEMLQDLLAMKR